MSSTESGLDFACGVTERAALHLQTRTERLHEPLYHKNLLAFIFLNPCVG